MWQLRLEERMRTERNCHWKWSTLKKNDLQKKKIEKKIVYKNCTLNSELLKYVWNCKLHLAPLIFLCRLFDIRLFTFFAHFLTFAENRFFLFYLRSFFSLCVIFIDALFAHTKQENRRKFEKKGKDHQPFVLDRDFFFSIVEWINH